MIMRNNKHILLITALLILNSCISNNKSTDFKGKLSGTYIFQYPTKEVEVLKINNDSTFYQEIYSNKSDFDLKNQPKYSNSGRWLSIKNNKIDFSGWLEYCYLRFPDSILPKPNISYMSNVFWEQPNKKHNGLISIYDETGYIFENILDWEN